MAGGGAGEHRPAAVAGLPGHQGDGPERPAAGSMVTATRPRRGPGKLQTSYGSLTIGLDAQSGQSLLIRGGTSSIGMITAVLAEQRGMTVPATTRNPASGPRSPAIGVDHGLIDDGQVARQVHAAGQRRSLAGPVVERNRLGRCWVVPGLGGDVVPLSLNDAWFFDSGQPGGGA